MPAHWARQWERGTEAIRNVRGPGGGTLPRRGPAHVIIPAVVSPLAGILRRTVTGVGFLLICLLAALPAWAQFPAPLGAVNDYVGVLTPAEVAELEAISLELEAKTGAALVVAIVRTHRPESLEDYVTRLFEHWGIGTKGKDDGVLIFLAMEDRALAIEVGYGLEDALTDARSGQIRDIMLPLFAEAKFAAGLEEGMRAVARVVAGKYGISLEETGVPPDHRPVPVLPVVLALAVITLLAVIIAVLGRPRCPRCRRWLLVTDRVIREATLTAGGLAARVYTCTGCGYSREQQYRTGRLSRGGPFIGPWNGGAGGWGRQGGGRSFGGFGGGRSGGGGARGKW